MHVVVVRSVDEVVLQSDQIDKVEEADQVTDEEVVEDYGVGKVDDWAEEVILHVDGIDKVYEVLDEVVLFIDDIDGVWDGGRGSSACWPASGFEEKSSSHLFVSQVLEPPKRTAWVVSHWIVLRSAHVSLGVHSVVEFPSEGLLIMLLGPVSFCGQSSNLSQISQIIFVEKKLSCGEILGNFWKILGNFVKILRNFVKFW